MRGGRYSTVWEHILRKAANEVEWSLAVAQIWCGADGFGDEMFGAADGFDGRVAEDELAEEGGGEGAAGAVGGGGFEVLAGESVEISRGETEEVGGLGLVSAGGDDVEVGVAGGESFGCGFGFGEGLDGLGGEGGELGPVGGDPGDEGEELVVEELEGCGWEELGSGAGSENGVEHDGGAANPDLGGLVPCR